MRLLNNPLRTMVAFVSMISTGSTKLYVSFATYVKHHLRDGIGRQAVAERGSTIYTVMKYNNQLTK